MRQFIYSDHLDGSLYTRDEYCSPTRCNQCGDRDTYLGEIDSLAELYDLITEEDGYIPYADWHLNEFILELRGRGLE